MYVNCCNTKAFVQVALAAIVFAPLMPVCACTACGKYPILVEDYDGLCHECYLHRDKSEKQKELARDVARAKKMLPAVEALIGL